MCGRFGLALSGDALAELLEVEPPTEALAPRYNIAPSQSVLALRQAPSGREVVNLQWGLVPFWARDRKIAYKLINARSETVAEKGAFKHAFAQRRCAVPADGFYEWKPEGKLKQPYHMGLADGAGFLMAGLWERWSDRETGEVLETCTLLTTEANPKLAAVHHRMPVILPPAHREAWLDPGQPLPPDIFAPYPADRMVMWPVSPIVNHANRDEPACRMRQERLL